MLFLRDLPFQCAQEIEARDRPPGPLKADAEAYRMLSNCYIAARENERALEPLAKAGELAPDGEMYMLLGQMHLQREHFDDGARSAAQGARQVEARAARIGAAPDRRRAARLEHFDDAERAFQAAANDAKVGDAARQLPRVRGGAAPRKQQHAASAGSDSEQAQPIAPALTEFFMLPSSIP